MKELLKQKISESISSVLPITLIVLILSFTNLAPMPAGMLILFLLGSVMLIVGMGFFSLGTDLSMMPMGTEVGRSISASKKMIIIVFLCFLIGFAVTVAEPDLQVLAKQFTAVPDLTIILTVATGVGLFLIIAALREFWGIRLQSTLIILYAIVFLVSFFVKPEFLPVAFDSGGVTTGPITVPFIIALGIGIAANQKNAAEDNNFGLVAICSIGPIITMLLMGIVLHSTEVTPPDFAIPEITDSQQVGKAFASRISYIHKRGGFRSLPYSFVFYCISIYNAYLS